MSQNSRSLILIDGSNFYNYSKRLSPKSHLSNFKYIELFKEFTQSTKYEACYYIGEIKRYKKNKKSMQLYRNQQTLFENLREQNVDIKLGYLLKSGGRYHEKGVDVQIAVDIVKGALLDEYDKFYLISSDTDILPAIKIARNAGKKVIYIGFESHKSRALSKNCNKIITIDEKIIKKFAN